MAMHTSLIRIMAALAVIGLITLGTVQAATLYKWTDEEGNVHYSQTRPEGHDADRMEIRDEAPPPADTGTTRSAEPSDQVEEAIPQGAGQNAERVRVRQQNCKVARENMEVYKTYRRVRQADGTTVVLSDEMRAAKIEEAQKMIDKYCN
ncbi:MAG: DUF4124 domain-containing protein [Gammaproteobacteria bacterium]|nr:DUF4124 domain-containing protein [Gammaproteobacteria bacterium]MCW8839572.1 DUF4124 domain-containing protein [Gammaproteobacteria bacterium]MCW8928085.1 DUF4124 domain-containing protein [Gammaproteobacteria bacterium]MCW8959283.1 DUF4124 domain-containing protein [Gammaproteobacteria bacterium]MCW8972786.1 DUF4124 domain-containing protein [Gammaproteobacteria bacterium]